MSNTKINLSEIQNLVGPVSEDDLQNVECFTTELMGLFIPLKGPCYYSVSPEHAHPSYSFIVANDNNCKIEIEGQTVKSVSGTVYGFSPGVRHHEVIDEDFSRYIAIMIDKKFFEGEFLKYTDSIPIFKCDSFIPRENLRVHLKDFILEKQGNMPGQSELLHSISLNIVHSIVRSVLNVESKYDTMTTRIDMDFIISYMHSNYPEPLTIEMLAEKTGYSTAHFSRLFKNETGLSPMDFFINIRLNSSKSMLMEGNLSVTEIAFRCGFNSSSHFTTSFKNRFSMPPSEYKKLMKEQNT